MSKNIVPAFRAVVENGKLIIAELEKFKIWLNNLNGKEVDVIVRKRKHSRSTRQNNYYWGVVVALVGEEMGVIDEQAHDFLREKFLKVGVDRKGRRFEVIRSTTSLSTMEFEEYLENIKMWAITPQEICEFGLKIPLPNEIDEDNLALF